MTRYREGIDKVVGGFKVGDIIEVRGLANRDAAVSACEQLVEDAKQLLKIERCLQAIEKNPPPQVIGTIQRLFAGQAAHLRNEFRELVESSSKVVTLLADETHPFERKHRQPRSRKKRTRKVG